MKSNITKYLLLAGLLSFGVTSCKNYLDREDTSGIVTPDLIWTNEKAIEAVLVNMYDLGIVSEDHEYWDSGDKSALRTPTTMSDEAQGSYQKGPLWDNPNAVYTYDDWLLNDKITDRFKHIRNTNTFIKNVSESTVLNEEQKKALDAEARWIRAFQYFGLVKRYGGLPLLTEPQQYDPSNFASMQVPRATEAEIYDFIINECNAIKNVLPETRSDAEKFRVSKGAALALISRAGLYAGTIAKYSGTISFSGDAAAREYVNIPSSQAEHFLKASYDASRELIYDMQGIYSLKKASTQTPAGYAKNFYDIFSATTNGNNGEYIMQKQYVAKTKGHRWDKMNAPFSIRQGGWGCGTAPVLELVEEFEYIDGSEGKLKTSQNGKAIEYDNLLDVFADKDPRLFASVYVPGYALNDGTKMEWRRGVKKGNTRYTAAKSPSDDAPVTIDGATYKPSGKDGGADAGDASKTGFYQRKFYDEANTNLSNIDDRSSTTPWPLFRLGEIYLNHAEVCLEMNAQNRSEALYTINEIRSRAGIATITDGQLTIAKVRHERKVELAFEKHRYWDMKRWRISHLDVAQGGLTNFRGKALYPWYDVQTKKYIFEIGETTPKQRRLFLDRNYYNRLGTEDLSPNPLMVQNPGYAY